MLLLLLCAGKYTQPSSVQSGATGKVDKTADGDIDISLETRSDRLPLKPFFLGLSYFPLKYLLILPLPTFHIYSLFRSSSSSFWSASLPHPELCITLLSKGSRSFRICLPIHSHAPLPPGRLRRCARVGLPVFYRLALISSRAFRLGMMTI